MPPWVSNQLSQDKKGPLSTKKQAKGTRGEGGTSGKVLEQQSPEADCVYRPMGKNRGEGGTLKGLKPEQPSLQVVSIRCLKGEGKKREKQGKTKGTPPREVRSPRKQRPRPKTLTECPATGDSPGVKTTKTNGKGKRRYMAKSNSLLNQAEGTCRGRGSVQLDQRSGGRTGKTKWAWALRTAGASAAEDLELAKLKWGICRQRPKKFGPRPCLLEGADHHPASPGISRGFRGGGGARGDRGGGCYWKKKLGSQRPTDKIKTSPQRIRTKKVRYVEKTDHSDRRVPGQDAAAASPKKRPNASRRGQEWESKGGKNKGIRDARHHPWKKRGTGGPRHS